jgi:hypothetical protein
MVMLAFAVNEAGPKGRCASHRPFAARTVTCSNKETAIGMVVLRRDWVLVVAGL